MESIFSTSFSMANSHYNKGKWAPSEDELLRAYVAKFGEKKWKKISDLLLTRSPLQCLHRWTKILKPGMVKGPWTLEEDQRLSQWVRRYGANKWSMAAKMIIGRNGKQCRERWINHLNPEIKKGSWNDVEDEKIYQLYQKYGSAWSKIARHFTCRSENSIKNRFYATLRKFDHMKKRSEILSLAQVESSLDNGSNSEITTAEQSPENLQVKEENTAIETLFNEQMALENNWNFEDLKEEESSENKDIFINSCCEEDKKDVSLNQNNVMEILNDIMEDDKLLDEKILNMIDSLKSIELELMGKIAKTMKEENSRTDLRRNFQGFNDQNFEDLELSVLASKKRKLA